MFAVCRPSRRWNAAGSIGPNFEVRHSLTSQPIRVSGHGTVCIHRAGDAAPAFHSFVQKWRTVRKTDYNSYLIEITCSYQKGVHPRGSNPLTSLPGSSFVGGWKIGYCLLHDFTRPGGWNQLKGPHGDLPRGVGMGCRQMSGLPPPRSRCWKAEPVLHPG
jgi:hypothetical protein